MKEISSTGDTVQGEFKKEVKYKDDSAKRFETEIPTFADDRELSKLLEDNGRHDQRRAARRALAARRRSCSASARRSCWWRCSSSSRAARRAGRRRGRARPVRPQPGAQGRADVADGHLRGRRRDRRGQAGAAGDRRLPAATPTSTASSARASRAACCSRARPAPARRCSRGPWRARPACRSSRPRPPSSSRRSWASAPRACATCSSRPRTPRRRSSSSTSSTRSGAPAAAGGGVSAAHDEREQTLNQILTEMDGFDTDAGVIVLGATNRPEMLDPALLRPGRFDRRVFVQAAGRERPRDDPRGAHPLGAARRRRRISTRIAQTTPGMVGADLANLVNEAALLAARRGHERVQPRGLHGRAREDRARRRAQGPA